MILVILGIIIYVLFFIIVPGMSAIYTRRRWRNFREQISAYFKLPILNYENFIIGDRFNFYGKLESFVNDNLIWLKGETLSISLDLKNLDVYRLSKTENKLIKSSWSSYSSIMEGTSFYVAGTLVYRNGTPFIEGSADESLIVVLYDYEENIPETLIKKGRDRNELWNSFTPYSYICGVFILIILSYFAYKGSNDKANSFYLLLAAGTPFYFILPPGLLFYLSYRYLWDQSMRFSVLRDFADMKGKAESKNSFSNKSKNRERLSLLFYLLGYLLNIFIAGIILLKMYQFLIFR